LFWEEWQRGIDIPLRPLDAGCGLEKIVHLGAMVAIDTAYNLFLPPLHSFLHPIPPPAILVYRSIRLSVTNPSSVARLLTTGTETTWFFSLMPENSNGSKSMAELLSL